MKYIDADKLIAEIKGLQCEQGFDTGEAERAYQSAIKDILAFIDTLQQEQPDEKEAIEKIRTDAALIGFHLACGNGDKTIGECIEFWRPIIIDSLRQEQTEKIVQPTVTTKGWVAKDYNGAIRLFFLCKPQRIDDKRYKYWYGGPNASKQLPSDSFPDLKWEDEPIEVELFIR